MDIQERDNNIYLAHKPQGTPVYPWENETMGGELLGDLLSSGQLDLCNIYAHHKHPNISPYHIYRFPLEYTQDEVKLEIFMDTPIGFLVEGEYPIE